MRRIPPRPCRPLLPHQFRTSLYYFAWNVPLFFNVPLLACHSVYMLSEGI
jgi:hypothetical protein